MFHYVSLIVPVAVFLPTLLFFVFPPRNILAPSQMKSNPIYSLAEWIGRLGVCVLPIFLSIHIDKPHEVLALIGMIVCLLFYYSGWIRFFVRNREFAFLFSPMYGVPIPLAISPILYFLCASVILHSFIYLLSGLILAVGHIPASLNIYRQLQNISR